MIGLPRMRTAYVRARTGAGGEIKRRRMNSYFSIDFPVHVQVNTNLVGRAIDRPPVSNVRVL